MSTRPAAQVVAAPRRRLRKVLVFVLLGVVLGLLVILFLDRIYNPFEEGIGDRQLLVLAPPDADLLVFIPQVSRFLGELRDRPFSRALANDHQFQQFLRSDWARKTGAVEALSDAFRELDLIRARPPLGLDLWRDIAGEALLFAGYAPAGPGQPWQFIAMFRPGSWKVLAAVNVLVDPLIGDLGPIRRGLEQGGVRKIDRFRDSVTLGFARGPSISLARIRNVVVVGTEVERITRLKTTIERDRLPASPPPRYSDLATDPTQSPHEVRAVLRRRVADEQLKLTDTLNEQWGREMVSLLESTLPRFGGEDLVVGLEVDAALDLRVGVTEGSPRSNDLGRSFRSYGRLEAAAAFQRAAPLLPSSTFAFAHVVVDVPQFLDAFFQRPEIFSSADIANLTDALRTVEEIGDVEGLKVKLARICEGPASIGFFKQDRDVLDKPNPGTFVAWQVRNEQEVRDLLSSVESKIRERAARGLKSVIRDVVHTSREGVDLYEIVLPEGVVDDPRVTKLGIVVGRQLMIVTTFVPSFRELMKVESIDERRLAAEPVLAEMLEHGPDAMRLDCAIAGDAIYEWFDQAVEGWTIQKTTPSARIEAAWRANAQVDARQRGLRDGTAEFEKFVEEAFQRELDKVTGIERPKKRRETTEYLSYFRGLVRSVGFTIGDVGGLELGLRLELNESG